MHNTLVRRHKIRQKIIINRYVSHFCRLFVVNVFFPTLWPDRKLIRPDPREDRKKERSNKSGKRLNLCKYNN